MGSPRPRPWNRTCRGVSYTPMGIVMFTAREKPYWPAMSREARTTVRPTRTWNTRMPACGAHVHISLKKRRMWNRPCTATGNEYVTLPVRREV
jgi:hypothetical protein